MTHTTLSIRRLARGTALLAVLPLAAACSGGSTPTATSTPVASAVTSTTTPTTTTTTTTSTMSTTTAPAAGDLAAYCATLKTSWAELQTLTGNIGDREGLPKALTLLNRIETAAPAEVKPAWGDFIGSIETTASGGAKALTAAMPRMESAGTKIESHARTACGIDLGS
ncbi:hypothetical protein N865_00935 [Intrasporangium oryzae NRRL B-24470]|uniref:Lipoprotein n=1 Tax=Intrasporangium oryzae NRRL B-24470 TaxID=1386089 RepID=W9GGJ3_9MICO|nr:hypothetical protein [Intrasporangium oryzae]EWT02984.1 hypothetical protein N865_00935 [Intrasporangium oryzae NRRL B-24470]